MRVVAMVSGGKDSCYNMMQCVAEGHEIIALANVHPKDKGIFVHINMFYYIYSILLVFFVCLKKAFNIIFIYNIIHTFIMIVLSYYMVN